MRNQYGRNIAKSALYIMLAHSLTQRCVTAAAKRGVRVMIQFVRSPPPLPPVMPSRAGST